MRSSTVRAASALAALAVSSAAASAFADEPRNVNEPRVMMESGEVTNVIDSFDDGDLFDLNISLGFEYVNRKATILRETNIFAPGLTTGGYTSNGLNVAKYAESTSRLIPRIDIGIYKDIAAHISLPVILAHTRELTAIDNSGARGSPALAGAPGETLFSLPFKSPTRSGLEYIGAGFDFNIFNQARDRTKPTWLFGFEGRFTVGTPMHACNPSPAQGQLKCANPADINRNGKTENPDFEGTNLAERSPGVTRGTMAIEVHTMMSKRYKYIEPYGGFAALFEFQQTSSDYGLTNFDTTLVNHPPFVGTMTLGMMIIPWENREKFSRVTLDFRFQGQYKSEGRDYSELFDALGSSGAPSLRQPQWSRYMANPNFSEAACTDNDPNTMCLPRSIVDQGSDRAFTTGLTTVQAHGNFRLSGSITWQAGEYVKFTLGGGFRHDQGHLITADQPCNPSLRDDPQQGGIERAGPCRSGSDAPGSTVTATGVPNPNYRPTINNVGRRYFVDGSNGFDIFASGVVMF